MKSVITGFWALFTARIIPTVLLIIVCLFAVKTLLKLTDRIFDRIKVPKTVLGILRAVVKVLFYFLAVLIVLGYLGIPVTSLIAAMSIVGVALSLGVQNFLTNVVGGLQMLVSHPFNVGDYVEAAGCAGTVTEIGLFYTKMMTPDNKLVQMPNSSVVSSNIVNYSAEPTRRVDLTVTASYDAPVEKVEAVLSEMVLANEKVLKDPAPFARVSSYGASSIEYTVRAWCNAADYWDVYFALIKGFKTAFDEGGIEMTFDHLNVHVVEK